MNAIKKILITGFILILGTIVINIQINHSGNVSASNETPRDEIADALSQAMHENRSILITDPDKFELGDLKISGDYAILNALSWPNDIDEGAEATIPTVVLALAKHGSDGWEVHLESTLAYQNMLPQIPDTLLDADAKRILLASELAKQDSLSVVKPTFPGLPWTIGTSWKLSQDLHGSSTNASDFATLDGQPGLVRAVDEGVFVYSDGTCVSFKRSDNIYHAYQHIQHSDIANWGLGDTVSYQDEIGYTTVASGCGGNTSGHHVHFWIYDQESVHDNKLYNPLSSRYGGWMLYWLRDEGETLAPSDDPHPKNGYDYPFVNDEGEIICAEQIIRDGVDICTGHNIFFDGFEMGACENGAGAGATGYEQYPRFDFTAKYVRDRICEAYDRNSQYLGEPYDNGGGIDVHPWGDNDTYRIQDITSDTDNNAAIIFNPYVGNAFVVRDGIWEYYSDDNFNGVYNEIGGPVTDEIDTPNDNEVDGISYFQKGAIVWRDSSSSAQEYNYSELYSNLRELPEFFGRKTIFRDVPRNHLFFKEIQALEKEKITVGCYEDDEGNRFFCPEQPTPRGHFGLLLGRTLYGDNIPPLPRPNSTYFEDTLEDNLFTRSVENLLFDDIVEGYVDENSDRVFGYNELATRGAVIVMIVRALNLPVPNPIPSSKFTDIVGHPFETQISVAYDYEITHGYSDNTFRPDVYATRGAAAKFLCRAFLHQCDGKWAKDLREDSWAYNAPGIKVKRNNLVRIAMANYEHPHIRVEVAYDLAQNDNNAPLFWRKPLFRLVRENSNAKDSGSLFPEFHPFISVNATGFDCNNLPELPIIPIPYLKDYGYLSDDSIIRIPEYSSTISITEGISNLYTSFFWYDGSPNLDAFIRSNYSTSQGWTQHDHNSIDTFIANRTLALGYSGKNVIVYEGEIVTPPENLVNNRSNVPKTAIGVGESEDGDFYYIYLATGDSNISLEDFSQQLIDSGVNYAITLDGGGSTQFYSHGENANIHKSRNRVFTFASECPRQVLTEPRWIPNGIVIYNEAANSTQVINLDSSGGLYQINDSVSTIFEFDPFGINNESNDLNSSLFNNTSSQTVTLYYTSQPITYSTHFQETEYIFSLEAVDENGSLTIPSKPYTLTVSYDPRILPERINESSLAIYSWNNGQWERETSVIDTINDTVTATPDRLGLFTVFAEDIEAPQTHSVVCCQSPGMDGYYLDDVTLKLVALDAGVGVSQTWYRLDSGLWTVYTRPITITNQGPLTFEYYAVDWAGNVEDTHSRQLFIDKVAPTGSLSLLPEAPDGEGFYTVDVTVVLTGTEHGEAALASGLRGIRYRLNYGPWQWYEGAVTVQSNGRNLLEYYAVDVAGNQSLVAQTIIPINKTGVISFIPLDASQSNHRQAYEHVFQAIEQGKYPRLLQQTIVLSGTTYSQGSIIVDGAVNGNFSYQVIPATFISQMDVLYPRKIALFESSSPEGRATWSALDFYHISNDYLRLSPFTTVDEADIASGLTDYDLLILPAGLTDQVLTLLTEADALSGLADFVQGGGWLYAQGDAVHVAELAGLLPTNTVGVPLNLTGAQTLVVDQPDATLAYNWLTPEVTTFKDAPRLTPQDGAITVAHYASNNEPAILYQPIGQGGVIVMGPHPTQDNDTYALLFNALFLAQSEQVQTKATVTWDQPGVVHNTIPAFEEGVWALVTEETTVYDEAITNFSQHIVLDPAFTLVGVPTSTIGSIRTQVISDHTEILWQATQLPAGAHEISYEVATTTADTLKQGEHLVSHATIVYEEAGQQKTISREAAIAYAAEPPQPRHVVDGSKNNVYPLRDSRWQHEQHDVGNVLSTPLHNGTVTVTVPYFAPAMDAFDQTQFVSSPSGATLWFIHEYSGYADQAYARPTTATSSDWVYNFGHWNCYDWVRIPNPNNERITIPPELADYIQIDPETGDILVPGRVLAFDIGSLAAYDVKAPAVRYRVHSEELWGRDISVSEKPVANTTDVNSRGFSVYTRVGQYPIPFPEHILSGAINNPQAPVASAIAFNDIWGRNHVITESVTSGFYDVVPVFFGPGPDRGDHEVDYEITVGLADGQDNNLTDYPIYQSVTLTAMIKVQSHNFALSAEDIVMQYLLPRGFRSQITFASWTSNNGDVVLLDQAQTAVPAFELFNFQGPIPADEPTIITLTARLESYEGINHEGAYQVSGGGGIAAQDQLAGPSQVDTAFTNPFIELGYQANVEAIESIAPINVSLHGGTTYAFLTIQDADEPQRESVEVFTNATLGGDKSAQIRVGMSWGPDLYFANVPPGGETLACLEMVNNTGIDWTDLIVTPLPAAGLTLTPLFEGLELPPNLYDAPYMWAENILDIGRGIYCWHIAVEETVAGGVQYPIHFTLAGTNVPDALDFPLPTAYVGVENSQGQVYRAFGQATLGAVMTNTVPLYVTPETAVLVTAAQESAFLDLLNRDIVNDTETAVAYLATLSQTIPLTVSTPASASHKIVTYQLPPALVNLPQQTGTTFTTSFKLLVPLTLAALPTGQQPVGYGLEIPYVDDFGQPFMTFGNNTSANAHGADLEGEDTKATISSPNDPEQQYIFLNPDEPNLVHLNLTIGNRGDYPALNSLPTIMLAPGVEPVTADPMWTTQNGQQLTWSWPSILPGDVEVVNLTVSYTPSSAGYTPPTDTSSPQPIYEAAIIEWSEVDYVDGYVELAVNETLGDAYHLPVGLPGLAPADLTAVLVQDNTAQLSWTGINAVNTYRVYHSHASDPIYFTNYVDVTGTGVLYEGLKEGTQHRFLVVALLNNEVSSRPSNIATLQYDWHMLPDLEVTVSSNPASPVAGLPLTYTITTANEASLMTATTIVLTQTLPLEFSYIRHEGNCVYNSDGLLSCSLAALNPNQSASVTVVVDVPFDEQGRKGSVAEAYSQDFSDPYPSDNRYSLNQQVIAISDLALAGSVPVTVVAGTSINYIATINYEEGPSRAWEPAVTFVLPLGLSFVQSADCLSHNAQTVVCASNYLDSGQSVTVQFEAALATDVLGPLTVNAQTTSQATDPNLANNDLTLISNITAEGNLEATYVEASTPVVAGTTATLTYRVANAGPSLSRDIQATITPLLGFTFVHSPQATCVEDTTTNELVCQLADLDAGQVQDIDVVFAVDAAVLGEVSGQVTATSTTFDPILGNDTDTFTLDVMAVVDLSTNVTAAEAVIAGTSTMLTTTIANDGPSLAHSIVVTYNLPTGVTALANTHCTVEAHQVICAYADLMPQNNDQATLLLEIQPSILGSITITATANSQAVESTPTNNITTTEIEVTALSDGFITADEATVIAGTLVTYTIQIHNDGPSLIREPVVQFTLPSILSFIDGASGCYIIATHTIECSINDVLPSASTTSYIVASVPADLLGMVTTAVVLESATADPILANNEIEIMSEVNTESDLRINHMVPSSIIAGVPFTKTYTFTNDGPSYSHHVVTTETLPAGFTLGATEAPCTVVDDAVACEWETVASDAQVNYVLPFIVEPHVRGLIASEVSVSSSTNDPFDGNNVHTVPMNIMQVVDLVATAVVNPTPVIAGQTLTQTVAIHNNGPSQSSQITATIELPDDVNYLSSGASCQPQGQQVTCLLGELSPQNDLSFNIQLAVEADAIGQMALVTMIDSDSQEIDPSDNVIDTVFEVVSQGYMNINLQTAPTVTAGTPLTYSVTIGNFGSSVAWNTIMTLTLPTEIETITYILSESLCEALAPNKLVCALGDLDVDQRPTIAVAGVVDSGALPDTITAEAIVSSDAHDPIPNDNISYASSVVFTEADLHIDHNLDVHHIQQGTITQTIYVTNIGPSDAASVVVLGILPEGTIYKTGPSYCYAPDSILRCDVGILPSHTTSSIQITLDIEPRYGGYLESTVIVESSTTELNPQNNTSYVSLPVYTNLYLPVFTMDER